MSEINMVEECVQAKKILDDVFAKKIHNLTRLNLHPFSFSFLMKLDKEILNQYLSQLQNKWETYLRTRGNTHQPLFLQHLDFLQQLQTWYIHNNIFNTPNYNTSNRINSDISNSKHYSSDEESTNSYDSSDSVESATELTNMPTSLLDGIAETVCTMDERPLKRRADACMQDEEYSKPKRSNIQPSPDARQNGLAPPTTPTSVETSASTEGKSCSNREKIADPVQHEATISNNIKTNVECAVYCYDRHEVDDILKNSTITGSTCNEDNSSGCRDNNGTINYLKRSDINSNRNSDQIANTNSTCGDLCSSHSNESTAYNTSNISNKYDNSHANIGNSNIPTNSNSNISKNISGDNVNLPANAAKGLTVPKPLARVLDIPFAGTLGGVVSGPRILPGGHAHTTNTKGEKRLSRYRSSPSKALLERMEVAVTMRMFLLKKYPVQPDNDLARRFVVLGTTGSIYTISIAHLPSCNCPDSAKGHHCCHILFIFLKVLKVATNDPVLYQRALLTSELKGIYKGAPASIANKCELGKSVVQCPLSGECPVCYEKLCNTDSVVWCKGGCGSNIHTVCFEKWTTPWVGTSEEVNCPLCESLWVAESGAADTPSTPPCTPPQEAIKKGQRASVRGSKKSSSKAKGKEK